MKFGKNGFSLLEVVVAMAVISINVLGLMRLQSAFSNANIRDEAFQEIKEVGDSIQAVLNDQRSCIHNLQNMQLGVEFSQSDITGLFKTYINDTGETEFRLDENNKRIPLIRENYSNKFSIKNYKLESNVGKDFLEVDYEINPNLKNRIGYGNIIRRYPLLLETDSNGNLASCQGGLEVDNADEYANQINCESVGGRMVGSVCDYSLGELPPIEEEECPEGSSYKLVYENGIPKLQCEICTVSRLWVEQKCEKKIKGMQWVNVCYYKSACLENPTAVLGDTYYEIGQMGGAKILDMVEFLSFGFFTNDKGGDAGSKRSCEKHSLPCPGQSTPEHDPVGIIKEAKLTSKDNSENAEDHFLDLKSEVNKGNINEAYRHFEKLKLAYEKASKAGQRATEALAYIEGSDFSSKTAAKAAQDYADEARKLYDDGFDLLK